MDHSVGCSRLAQGRTQPVGGVIEWGRRWVGWRDIGGCSPAPVPAEGANCIRISLTGRLSWLHYPRLDGIDGIRGCGSRTILAVGHFRLQQRLAGVSEVADVGRSI